VDEAQFQAIKSKVPGPGAYKDELRISKERNPVNNQQYPTSEYKNTRTTNFGKYSERFESSEFKGASRSNHSIKKRY
jgi:hypothetical protein